MRSRWNIGALALLLAVAGSARVAAAGESPPWSVLPPAGDLAGVVVRDVKVVGNRRVGADAILALLETVPGGPLDAGVLAADVGRIFAMKVFDDVKVVLGTTGKEEGVVFFVVRERPEVRAVKLVGHARLRDLDELVNVKPGELFDAEKTRRNAEKIRKKYENEGYALAEVTPELLATDDGRIDIVFRIFEGTRIFVRDINFIGNVALTDDELAAVLETRKAGFGASVSRIGILSKPDLDEDVNAILARYYDIGYLNAKVSPPAVTISRDLHGAYVTFVIYEGARYRVGRIRVSGDFADTSGDEGKLAVGDWFERSVMAEDVKTLIRRCRDRGHAHCSVETDTEVDVDARRVDVTHAVTRGPVVRVWRIEITGNVQTRDRVIRERLEISEGDLYSESAVDASRNALEELRFFDSVTVSSTPGPADDRIILKIDVVETNNAGGGQPSLYLSSKEGVIVAFAYRHRNLFGRGHLLYVDVEWSVRRALFAVRYVEPRFFGSRWRLTLETFGRDVARASFTTNRAGGAVSWEYPVNKELSLRGGYALFNLAVRRCGFTNCALDLLALQPLAAGGRISVFDANVVYERLDSRTVPTRGVRGVVTVEVADRFTGSHLSFTNVDATLSVHVPIVPSKREAGGIILRAFARFGYVMSNGSGEVPLSERLFAGGIGSVRGFDPQTIGPLARAAGQTPGDPLRLMSIGGTTMFAFNVELEFPLGKATAFKGVIFFDAGAAFGGLTGVPDLTVLDGDFSVRRIRTSVGFGLRVIGPSGPIRIEWGIPLWHDPVRNEAPIVFELNVGYDL